MENVSQASLKDFWIISLHVQDLQKKIEQQEISYKLRHTLHSQLEKLQTSLTTVRQNAHLVHQQFEELEGQIVHLYCVIEDKFDEHEITLISKQALELCHSIESGKVIQLAKKLDSLLYNIHFLFKHRRPSLQHRKIVQIILKLTEQAKVILDSKTPLSKAQIQTLHLLKMLLREAVLQAEKLLDPYEGEVAFDLYEICELFYRKKEKEAQVRLNLIYDRLTPEQKKQVDQMKENPHSFLFPYPIEA